MCLHPSPAADDRRGEREQADIDGGVAAEQPAPGRPQTVGRRGVPGQVHHQLLHGRVSRRRVALEDERDLPALQTRRRRRARRRYRYVLEAPPGGSTDEVADLQSRLSCVRLASNAAAPVSPASGWRPTRQRHSLLRQAGAQRGICAPTDLSVRSARQGLGTLPGPSTAVLWKSMSSERPGGPEGPIRSPSGLAGGVIGPERPIFGSSSARSVAGSPCRRPGVAWPPLSGALLCSEGAAERSDKAPTHGRRSVSQGSFSNVGPGTAGPKTEGALTPAAAGRRATTAPRCLAHPGCRGASPYDPPGLGQGLPCERATTNREPLLDRCTIQSTSKYSLTASR